jgi:hypothetical protein
MAITPEEKKKRQAVLESEKQIISKLNDTSEIRDRIRRDKLSNNYEVERVEGPQRKVAAPSSDPGKSL